MYKFFITILSSAVEVFPINFPNTSLVDEKQRDEVFYRRTFNGTLTFIGDDFDIFYMIEQASPCTDILFEIQQKDSGANTYHTYWNGHFSTTDGRFDLDRCSFEITPLVMDDYTDFLERGDEEFNILDIVTTVTTEAGAVSYTRNRWLMDVIEYIAQQIVPAANIVSEFFTADLDPVTLYDNPWKYVTIAQKSDIKRPTSTDPATTAMLSFNELMHILKIWNLHWTFDGTDLVIEHISHWEGNSGLDLRNTKIGKSANKYSYKKKSMPKYEKFKFMEASNRDFVGVDIHYDSPCVNRSPGENTTEYSNRVTTDLDLISSEPDGIADEGFVLLANYLLGGNYYVSFGYGILSAEVHYNMQLSWTWLHNAYFKHDRILLEGYMNDALTTFLSARKTKIQDIYAKVCYEDNYDPNDYITTELGDTFGEKGYVEKAQIKPSGEVSFTLAYGPEPEPPEPIAQTILMWIQIDAPNFTVDLSQPADNDILFWMYLDSTTCQEVLIPAGDIHYADTLDDSLPVEFNFTDPSVAFLEIYLNDGDTINLTANCTPAPTSVVCNSVGAILDGTEYDRLNVTINYTNSGVLGNATVNWRIKNSGGTIVDSGNKVLSFPNGTGNKAIPGLIYPAAGTNYTLEAKISTDAAYDVSNQFDTTV